MEGNVMNEFDGIRTPALVREFVEIKCSHTRQAATGSGSDTYYRSDRLGKIVDELRRRGVLD